MKNLLRIESNERVDIEDFKFLADESVSENVREIISEFLVSENNPACILTGFSLSSPSGSQLQVTRGKAILHQRKNGKIFKSVITTSGDLTKILDLSGYSSNVFGIYIRFSGLPDIDASRVFWDSTGVGSEYVKTIKTRYAANWDLAVELSNPGEEWFKIGEVDLTSGFTVTDQRSFYFEGSIADSYINTWGTDDDRNSDRAIYGISNLHTFLTAIKQCIEDIKGRGLKRWWDKGIGGLNIGFDTDPTLNRLAIFDEDFGLRYISNNCVYKVAPLSSIEYNRAANEFRFFVDNSSAVRLRLTSSALYTSSNLSLGTTDSPWNSYLKDTQQKGNHVLSCCFDDTAPSIVTFQKSNIIIQRTTDIYADGNSTTYSTRPKIFTKLDPSGFELSRHGVIEGLQVNTNINHENDPGQTRENNIWISSGVAYVAGTKLFNQGNISLGDLWSNPGYGGLTDEAKVYIGNAATGRDNCFWLYVWLRKDGTFWLEPWGPEILYSNIPWRDGQDRYSPRVISGLPQSGFIATDYALIDVCWLVYGKEKTSSTPYNVVNFSGALPLGNNYRAIERANYSDGTEIETDILPNTALGEGFIPLDLEYINTSNYYIRSPGIPSILTRKVRIAVHLSCEVPSTEKAAVFVGCEGFSVSTNHDLPQNLKVWTGIGPGSRLYSPSAFSVIYQNTSGSSAFYQNTQIVDTYVSLAYHAASERYKAYLPVLVSKDGGSSVITLGIQLLGFYWNRKDVLKIGNSIPTI